MQEKKNNSTDEKKTSSNNSTALKNTKVTELSIATDTNSVPSTSSLSTVEIQNVTAESKDLVLTFTQSSKKIQRINLISKFLAENHITCRLNDVKNYITKHEKTKPGDNGLIDQRSLKRLIYQMEREGQLKVMQIKITVEPYNSSLLFICEPSIDVHHIYVKRNIEQTKHKLILKKSQLSVDSQHVSQIWSCKKRIIGGPYPFLPKFARLRIFHEFLFYLTYAHKNKVVELPVDVQNLLRKEELFTEELPLAFEDSLEKCMFVPPLENIGFPSGWILLSDAISRLPLCLLSNLCFTNPNIPGISDYLNDPIRCQTMLKHLPPPVQYYLTYKGRYKFILHKIVEQLCLLGLVQFGKQIMKDKDKICIYINRNAILWDTTSSKPGYHKIEDKEYDKESFKFLTLDDIKKYWNRMCIICNNTRLGQRYAALGEEVESIVPEDKMSYALEKQEYDEAKKADIGYIPGDGQGAAGLDTMFYSHLKRSWTNNLIVANCVNSEKNPVLRKKNIASRGEKHFPPSISKSKKKVRVLKMRKPMNIRSPRHDDTDKKLMEKYGSKRTSWKSTEDQILFLFKIAFHIIYPPGFSMNFHIIRDFMNIVCKVAKPTSSYRRRMIYLMRRPQNFRQVEIHLTEFRRDEVINSNYNNLYNQMKKGIYKKKPISIVDDKCRIRLVELVNLLYQKFIEKNAQNQISILLPRTLNELYNEYEIETPSLYKPEHKEIISLDLKSEIKYNILKSLIHSAMSCSIGKETFTFSLFDTYKNFPEGMLRSTINSLRLSGMISVNKYELQGGDRKKIKTSTNASHFKLSQSYFIQAITTLPSTLYTEAYKYVDALKTELQTGNSAQVTGGGVAALFDLMSANLIDIHLVTPPSSSNALVSHSKSRFSKNKIVAQTECSVLSEKNMQRTYVIAGYGWNISACSDMESNIFYTSQVLDSISNEIIR